MDELKKNIALVTASLQVVAVNTEANTRGIQDLAEQTTLRNAEILKELQALNGTFASIERHMVKLFEEQAAIQAWREKIEARIDALEKRHPPAA